MIVLAFVFLLLASRVEAIQCAYLPIIGDGKSETQYDKNGDQIKTTGDWRPDFPDELIGNKAKGIEAQNFVSSHPIPINPVNKRPAQSTVITCFDDKVKLPPGLSTVSTASAKLAIQERDPLADVSQLDKAPAPETKVEKFIFKSRFSQTLKRGLEVAYDFLVAVAHAATATDLFNRADSADLGADWDAAFFTDCSIEANAVRVTTSSANCSETYNALVPGGSQYGKATLGQIGANVGDFAGPTVRTHATNDQFYTCIAETSGGSSTTRLRRRNSGGSTLATENSTTWVATDTIELRASGTALDCLRNGSTLLATTDATFATGRVGIFTFSADDANAFFIDSLELGDFGGVGVSRGKVMVIH